MAHVAIGALRSAGVPARYVSGYLHPKRRPEVGDTVVGESHAWIEWWDGDWVGFDPTNDVEPGDRHIVVARGRDYSDVSPLKGIFSGGSTSSMSVDVRVTRVS
jgi:transglutaminase-like putative cysteine protease